MNIRITGYPVPGRPRRHRVEKEAYIFKEKSAPPQLQEQQEEEKETWFSVRYMRRTEVVNTVYRTEILSHS